MKPSMSTLYFSELSPRQMVPLFAKHGWNHLELSECHAHDLAAQGDPERIGAAFRRFAADHGVTFLQGHLPVCWYHDGNRRKGMQGWFDIAPESDLDYARAMGVTKRCIDLFTAIGIRFAVGHMGGSFLKKAGWSDDAVFERRAKGLSENAEYAASGDITLCLENLSFPDCGVETLEEISTFVAGAGTDNLAICFDSGHAVLAGLDCAEFVLDAGSLITALHVHENAGATDDHVLPYERGTIPWDRVLAALRDTEYVGLFNLESLGRPWRPMPVREARLDYAQSLASYMVRQAPCASNDPGV